MKYEIQDYLNQIDSETRKYFNEFHPGEGRLTAVQANEIGLQGRKVRGELWPETSFLTGQGIGVRSRVAYDSGIETRWTEMIPGWVDDKGWSSLGPLDSEFTGVNYWVEVLDEV